MAEKLDITKIKGELVNPIYEVDYATPNKNGALFLPSISSLYTKHVSKTDAIVRKGDCPAGMASIKQLDLLDPSKGMFWYPWVLYSAGHAQLNLTKTDIQEEMIQKRNKDHTFVLADSGGYQLSTGVLKGDFGDINEMTAQPNSLRHKILKWMEHTADFSMILDIPTTSCKNPKSIIYKRYPPEFITYYRDKDGNIEKDDDGEDKVLSRKAGYTDMDRFYKCLEYTVKNNAYFIRHRTPEDTKLLNVLQGRDIPNSGPGENDIWYNVVKYFNIPEATMADVKDAYNTEIVRYGGDKIGLFEIDDAVDYVPFGDRAFEGWAIPGNLKFDFQMLMKRFKIMADDGFFEDTGENLLIHFLGISRVSAGLLYTTLQNELRTKYNPNVIITYDAASPFVCTAKGKGYGDYTVSRKKMTYAMETLPDKKYITTDDNGLRWYNSPEKINGKRTRIQKKYDPNLNWHDYHKTNKVISIPDAGAFNVLFDGGNTYTNKIIRQDTTLGKKLMVKDICYKDGKDNTTKSYWDGTSYVYIMNMNVEQHIRAIQEAYSIYFQGDAAIKNQLPPLVFKGKNAIEQIVRSNFSKDTMTRLLPDLKNILGMKPQSSDGVNLNELDEGIEDDDE